MFGGKDKIKLDPELMERLRRCSEIAGYSSVDEFIQHVLEKELARFEEGGASEDEIRKRMQGLGYIS